jgi:hypothetical protein
MVILAPCRNNPNSVESFNIKTDFDIEGNGLVWYARTRLFLYCTLCPTGANGRSGSHKEVSLVYFSTFGPINLTPWSFITVMQRAGVPMLYDSATNRPCLYICPVTNVLERAPLIPCFVAAAPPSPEQFLPNLNESPSIKTDSIWRGSKEDRVCRSSARILRYPSNVRPRAFKLAPCTAGCYSGESRCRRLTGRCAMHSPSGHRAAPGPLNGSGAPSRFHWMLAASDFGHYFSSPSSPSSSML